MNVTKLNMKRAAEFPLPSSAARKVPKSKKPQKMDSEIHNLPSKDFVVTREILKNNVCRICATYYESGPMLVPLYLHHDSFRLSKVINTFLPIKVRKDDGLPEYACRSCTDILLAWRDIRDNCREAAKILNSQAELTLGELTEGTHTTPRNNDRSAEPPAFNEADSPDNDTDEDSESAPLAGSVSADPLAALRTALGHLRDHYTEHHLRCRPSSGSDAAEESDPRETDLDLADPDSYDDLTCRNMRRDRFDEPTRRGLHAARVRVDGRTHYACPDCGRRLASPHAFVHHARIHTGERPQVCHVCGKRFRAPQGLARHVAETHELRRRRSCHLCARTFANDQNLKQHLRIHTGERPHRCNECGKRFAQSGALHSHRRTHSAVREFACAECGAAFRLRAGLARHAMRHSGARPHRCGCGRSFAARHELLAHLPLHGERAPHECATCGARYKLRRALRDHARRDHPPPTAADLTRASAFPGTTPT